MNAIPQQSQQQGKAQGEWIETDSCLSTFCGLEGRSGGLDSSTSVVAGTPCLCTLGGRVEELAKQMSMCVQLSSLSTSSLGVVGTPAYPSLTCTTKRACSQHCSLKHPSRLSLVTRGLIQAEILTFSRFRSPPSAVCPDTPGVVCCERLSLRA